MTRRIALLDGQVDRLRNGGDGALSMSGEDEIARLADNVQELMDEVVALQRRRAEARHGLMVQHNSDIVMLCDETGVVAFATPALKHTLDVDPASAIGRTPARGGQTPRDRWTSQTYHTSQAWTGGTWMNATWSNGIRTGDAWTSGDWTGATWSGATWSAAVWS